MARYRINCSTTVQYTLVVEAPTRGAAQHYYDMCDGGEFNRCSESYGWDLESIEIERSDEDPDVVVGEDGRRVEHNRSTGITE